VGAQLSRTEFDDFPWNGGGTPRALLVDSMVQFESQAREFLLTRRHRLRRQVAGTPPAVLIAGGPWFDTEALPEPVGEEARRELADVEAALQRIEQGSYGTCLACGGPMGLQRMRAIPEARYCVGCSGHHPEVE
jgi:DnaK suppressor protein